MKQPDTPRNSITALRLQYFRSYVDESFEFDDGVNIIVGPNASGKTNLLEAILVLARGDSYRAKDSELIRFQADWGRLDGQLASGHGRVLKLTREPPGRSFELDGKAYQRLSLNNTLPVVLFEPNHLRLLSGSQQQRREYLDDLLSQTRAGYGGLCRQYRRTLAQRNALLKRPGNNLATQLFPWNIRLSQLAGQIVRARHALARTMHDDLPLLYRELSNAKTAVSLQYQAQGPVETYETHLVKKLEQDAELDRQRGFTAAGPHREDLLVTFDGHPVQETASRGEIRTAVLAFKITELKLLAAARNTTPLLLLDDVFSELDGRRRHALTDHLAAYQTFITTTDADVIVKDFTRSVRTLSITPSP